jgi:uncharacterized membrane protein YesL
MKKESTFIDGLTNIGSQVFDVVLLGLLWLAFSIPLVTIGAASTAFYYALIKLEKKEGYAFRNFLSAFKDNFRQSTIIWLVAISALFILELNAGIMAAKVPNALGLFFVMLYRAAGCMCLLVTVYALAGISRYRRGLIWIVKIASYMTVRYFHISVCLLVAFAVFGLIVYRWPFTLIIVPSPLGFAIAEMTRGVIAKHE